MNNHESRVNISINELAKRSGIVFMAFHPHTTHKMQPLDHGVFRCEGKSHILTDTHKMKVILHSKSNNEQCQKPTSRQIKPSAKQIIFHLQSDTSLNDESSN